MSSSETSDDEIELDLDIEFADITPIPIKEEDDAVMKIAYTEQYSKAMDYFRAVSRAGEISDRALKLCSLIIQYNPAHYTIWNYRQKLVRGAYEDEFQFTAKLAKRHPKSYQIWHHRQYIVKNSGIYQQEMQFINTMLESDAKNYHAWTYRQWLVETYELWDEDLGHVNLLIDQDLRNNSAWNQRYWLFCKRNLCFESEVQYALDQIKKAPRNESSWNYLKGFVHANSQDREG